MQAFHSQKNKAFKNKYVYGIKTVYSKFCTFAFSKTRGVRDIEKHPLFS